MKTLIVIPTYNERDVILDITQAVFAIDDQFEILVVDDNSPDGTAEVVRAMQKAHPRLHLHIVTGKQIGRAHV